MDAAGQLLYDAHQLYDRSGGMGGNSVDRPPAYKIVGIILAISSGLFIGVSFVLKKHGSLKANDSFAAHFHCRQRGRCQQADISVGFENGTFAREPAIG